MDQPEKRAKPLAKVARFVLDTLSTPRFSAWTTPLRVEALFMFSAVACSLVNSFTTSYFLTPALP